VIWEREREPGDHLTNPQDIGEGSLTTEITENTEGGVGTRGRSSPNLPPPL
jgi:hypothetical protein